MKKLFTLILIAATVAMTADALSFSGKKWYVNPGHGGHDSSDRPTPLPNGQTPIFYESDGNLTRCMHVRDLFVKYGGTVKMSRTKNTSSDDLALSTISSQSSSYGGYFLSAHTNAGNASANYTIAFYWANATSANQTAGQKMGKAVVDEHAGTSLTNTTYSTPRCGSDYSFMGFCFGVLRNNTAKGYLVESWFHDYRPEALRLKSKDYNRFLAWQIIKGFAVYPQQGTGLKGGIIGDIRDTASGCGYSDYAYRGRDSYKAINGAKVTLKDSSGATVSVTNYSAGSADDSTYHPGQVNPQTTDKFNNGVYFFDELAAGTYTVEVSASGYATQTKSVTVSNDKVTKCCFDMKTGTSTGITLSATTWNPSTTVGTPKTKSITVTASGLSDAITVSSNNTNFTLSTTSIAKTGGSVTVTYNPSAAGTHTGKITFTSGTQKETLAVSGTATNPPLTFTEGWNYSQTSGKTASWVSDFSTIRNMDFGAGKLYVVNPGNAVYIINAQTGAKMGELPMTGVSGGALSLIDVKYVDGKIVGCNIAANASASTGTFKIYCWNSDSSTPQVLLETTNIGGKARIGDCMALKGNLTNGAFMFAAGGTSEDNTIVSYAITNGVVSTTPTVLDLKDDDGKDGIKLGLSPRVIPESNGQYWAAGQEHYPILFTEEGKEVSTLNPSALADIAGNSFKVFTYKGTPYGLATDYTGASAAADRLKGGKMVLVDGSNGWAQAEKVADYPSAGLGSTRNTSMSSSICTAVNGSSGVEAWILVHNQGIAYYKTGTPTAWNPVITTEGPTILASKSSVGITTEEGTSATGSVTFTGALLTNNITLTLSGTNASLFSIDKTSIAQSGGAASGKVTITYSPTAAGNHTAKLTASSSGAPSVTVTLNGTATEKAPEIDPAKFVYTKVMESTNVPASNDGRFSTGFGGYLYVNDKTNKQILRYDDKGNKSVFANIDGTPWTAITTDDAGNILINQGSAYGTNVSPKWFIIEPNGTQHTLTLTYPSGTEGTGRNDAVGRVVGNVLSSAGGYMCVLVNGATSGAIFKIVNGSQSGTATAVDLGFTADATAIAQPCAKTVAAVAANPASSFMYRLRTAKQVVTKAFTRTSTDGFDVFTLGDKTYLVEPSGAKNYSDGYTIHELGSDDVLAEHPETVTDGAAKFQSITARVSDDGSYALIYQNVSGKLVSIYRFGMPATGVESVTSDSTVVETSLYNLQGVKVMNPAPGQIYIRVNRMSDGSVKSSKIVVK